MKDRPVPMERILSVFDVLYGRSQGRAAGGSGRDAGSAADAALAHLTRLGWIRQVRAGRKAEGPARYRCDVPREVAEDVAKSVDFDLGAYLPRG